MVSHQIVALPGDGIGPEVVAEAIKVLETIQNASSSNITFNIASHDFGGIAIDNHGDPLPESTLSACKASDAIILGQFGGVVRAYNVLMVLTFNAFTKPLRIHLYTVHLHNPSLFLQFYPKFITATRCRRRTEVGCGQGQTRTRYTEAEEGAGPLRKYSTCAFPVRFAHRKVASEGWASFAAPRKGMLTLRFLQNTSSKAAKSSSSASLSAEYTSDNERNGRLAIQSQRLMSVHILRTRSGG